MKTTKTLRLAAAVVTAATALLSPKATAQEITLFDNSKITITEERTNATSDSTLIANGKDFSVGMTQNYKSVTDAITAGLQAKFQTNDGRTRFLIGANQADTTAVGLKINHDITQTLTIGAGAASGQTYFVGAQLGKKDDQGVQLAFIREGGEDKVRLEVWKYFAAPNIFVGAARDGDTYSGVLSMPSQDGLAVRTNYTLNSETGNWSATGIIGISRKEDPISANDSFARNHDNSVIGNKIRGLPGTAPLLGPLSNLPTQVKNWGARVTYSDDSLRQVEFEALKYVDSDNTWWIGGTYKFGLDDKRNTFGIEGGMTTNNITFGLDLRRTLETNETSVGLTARLRF